MKRVDSVDVLRGISLALMVLCHYPLFLSSGEGEDAMYYFFANHLLGGDCGAAWFVFLAGLSQVLSDRKRGTGQDRNISRTIVRGAAIFIMGLLFLLVVQGYGELWDWDILTFIGAVTIILIPCRNISSWTLLLFCAAVVLVTPWLRSFIDIAPFYGGKFEQVKWISDYIPNYLFDPAVDYHGAGSFTGNVLGFVLIGQFPILPWVIFPILGFVIGRRMTQNHLAADAPFILMIGIIFTFMGLFTAYAGSIRLGFSVANDYITPLSFYPASFSMMMLQIGVLLMLYNLLWRIFDANPDSAKTPGMFLKFCRQFSKYSLTIYITHFALFFIPLRIIKLTTGSDYLGDLLSTPGAYVLAILVVILFYPLLMIWDKAGGKYSFEWLLAKLLSGFK